MFKKLLENVTAVVFDLDGTLVDTERLWTQAIYNVCETEGINGYFRAKFEPGTHVKEKWLHILALTGAKPVLSLSELIDRTNDEFLNQLPTEDFDTKDGFWSLAAELKLDKAFKVGLATNSFRSVTTAILSRLKLTNFFDAIVCGDEVKRPKPYKDSYVKIAQLLQTNPENLSVFEDSAAGVEAAFAAGVKKVTVIWDQQTSKLKFNKHVLGFIPDFTALPGNLDTTKEEELMEKIDFLEKFQANPSTLPQT